LIGNYVTRIIAPLASRCAKFRFQALPGESMRQRLTEIARCEHLTPEEVSGFLPLILQYADGDMRKAVTTLQSVHALIRGGAMTTSSSSSSLGAEDLVAEIAGTPPPRVVQSLFDACTQSSSFDAMHRGVEDVMAAGFSAPLILSALLTRILEEDDRLLEELSRAQIAIRIAEAEKNMIDGADEYLQLMTVCSLIFSCCVQQRSSSSMRQ
jgi:replication factor C subunit 2/4